MCADCDRLRPISPIKSPSKLGKNGHIGQLRKVPTLVKDRTIAGRGKSAAGPVRRSRRLCRRCSEQADGDQVAVTASASTAAVVIAIMIVVVIVVRVPVLARELVVVPAVVVFMSRGRRGERRGCSG
jgi:hypothetical protein